MSTLVLNVHIVRVRPQTLQTSNGAVRRRRVPRRLPELVAIVGRGAGLDENVDCFVAVGGTGSVKWSEAVLVLRVDLTSVTNQSAADFGIADKGGIVEGRLPLTVRLGDVVLFGADQLADLKTVKN